MPWPWQVRQDRQATAARLGLSGLLPLRSPDGGDIGVMAGPDGTLTAMLTIEGRRLWLDETASVEAALAAMTGALAGPPVQLLLRRRRLDATSMVDGWATLARANLADRQHLVALTDDYAGLLTPSSPAGGLARVTAALAVPAASPSQLWRRVAALTRRLPGVTRVLDMAALADWVRDWAGADDLPPLTHLVSPTPATDVAPARLHVTGDRLLLGDTRVVRLWRLVGLPSLVELGWVRHHLADPALADLEWDLSLHCWPPADDAAERQATERALRATAARLARAADESRPLARGSVRALQRDHRDLSQRLAALDGGGRPVRRVGLWLAVRDATDGAAAATLGRLGFRLAPVCGRLAVEHAWRAVGPLCQPPPGETLPLVLTAAELAPLAWWAVAPDQPAPGWPVTLVTPERTPLLSPVLLAGDDHLVVTGATDGARTAVQSWALEAAWRGRPALLLQAGGDWAALASAAGGHVCWLGPEGDHGLDPITGDGYPMATLAGWLTWLEESMAALAALLPGHDSDLLADLRAGLVEVGHASLEGGPSPGLPALLACLEASGYERAATVARQALTGRWRWLTGPPPDLTALPSLTGVGWAGGDQESYPVIVSLLLRRLRRLRDAIGGKAGRPLTIVVDDGELLLRDARAAATLADIARAGGDEGLRLWLVAGASSDLARSLAGRTLLAHARSRAAFAEPTAPAHVLVDALGWSPAAARLIPVLPPDVAVLRRGPDLAVARVMTGPMIAAAQVRGRRPFAPAIAAPALGRVR